MEYVYNALYIIVAILFIVAIVSVFFKSNSSSPTLGKPTSKDPLGWGIDEEEEIRKLRQKNLERQLAEKNIKKSK